MKRGEGGSEKWREEIREKGNKERERRGRGDGEW